MTPEEKQHFYLSLRITEIINRQETMAEQLTRIESLLKQHEIEDSQLKISIHIALAEFVTGISNKVEELRQKVKIKDGNR